MNIATLNAFSKEEAHRWFSSSCTANRWCELMVKSRPFESITDVVNKAEYFWSKMEKDDVLEAFSGHPMIGDVSSLKAKYAYTSSLAASEQGGMDSASEEVFIRLSELNKKYLANHGFIFIICASGLSAMEMLSAIEDRVMNSTSDEYRTAAGEQLKITRLRITNALNEYANQ